MGFDSNAPIVLDIYILMLQINLILISVDVLDSMKHTQF